LLPADKPLYTSSDFEAVEKSFTFLKWDRVSGDPISINGRRSIRISREEIARIVQSIVDESRVAETTIPIHDLWSIIIEYFVGVKPNLVR